MINWTDLTEATKAIREITDRSKPRRHKYYKRAVEHAAEMGVHINGDMPGKLLSERRPNEPQEIFEYRKQIYKPVTKSRSKKVINVLSRIDNERNYTIQFQDKGEGSLHEYVTKDYPFFESYTRWVFDVGLKQMLADPNSAVGFIPLNILEMSEDDTQRPEPFGFTYSSRQMLDYSLRHWYLFLEHDKSEVKVGTDKKKDGNIFTIFSETHIVRLFQVGKQEDEQYDIAFIYEHNIGEPPVIIFGGEYVDGTFPFFYESFMSGVLPYWDDALREYSDKQAVFVNHVYLERVEMAVECDYPQCGKDGMDVGFVCDDKGTRSICPKCKGSGTIVGRSPFGVTRVKKSELSVDNPVFPGVQYIDKPTEIVELLKRDIEDLIYDGYAALNMEFLSEAPANQSGKAKEFDRAELTTYLLGVSNNIFDNIIKNGYYFIAALRYGVDRDFTDLLPRIVKPTDFDITSLNEMISQFGQTANLPREVKDEMSLEIINKKFAGDDFKRELHTHAIILDPLRGKTSDEKFTALSNRGITKEDYVISENIYKLLMLAVENDADFFSKSFREKYEALVALAAITEAPKVELFDDGGADSLGKIPLAAQQLALARERAIKANDTQLAAELGRKIDELLAKI